MIDLDGDAVTFVIALILFCIIAAAAISGFCNFVGWIK